MSDTRCKNLIWSVCLNGHNVEWQGAQLAVLMDIRDELQSLSRMLSYPNFIEVLRLLRDIRRNTTKKRRKVKKS